MWIGVDGAKVRWAAVVVGLVGAFAGCGAGPSGGPVVRSDLERPRSVPEYLATLPESLRSHHVLLFETRSPQPSSYDAPRALLFDDDAKLVVGFSGASDTVDLMEFDEASSTFVFREVTFPGGPGAPRMQLSESNPPRCQACHGSPPRPLWDSYPVWPGAYGETETGVRSQDEHDGMARFEARRMADPRYRLLGSRGTSESEVAEARYRGDSTMSPNGRLGQLLGALNARMIAADLARQPSFEARRGALLAALASGCADGDASYGPAFAAFAARTAEANARAMAAKGWRSHAPLAGLPRAPGDGGAMTRFRYVAETELGVSTDGWTLAMEKGTFDFTTSHRAADAMPRRLFALLASDEPQLLEAYWQGADPRSLCATLARRVRRTRGGDGVHARAAHAAQLPPLARCASCHEHGVGPPLPFGHDDALVRELAATQPGGPSLVEAVRGRLDPSAGALRMPPNYVTSAAEREEILRSLTRLGGRSD